MSDLILAIDQGSSSTKALLVSSAGAVTGQASVPVTATYPRPGWVEQSLREISDSVRAVVRRIMAEVDPARVAGVALSNQRESLGLWESASGEPVGSLVSWQDQRTAQHCETLLADGHGSHVLATTGLPVDPMFSGGKARWLLDDADPGRSRSRRGELRLGTIDAWLLHELTGEHLTEVGNASRTQLLNLGSREWDDGMLSLFDVPAHVLPRVVASAGPFPEVKGLDPLLDGTPVVAVMADSHAALFAHGAWTPGAVKATYGTGSSVMGVSIPSGDIPERLCSTVAWEAADPVYAVEGNIRSSGSTLAWLARTVGRTPGQLAELAGSVPSSEGVHLVPAFNGLAAPWWDSEAVGVISGLTLGTGLPQLARAALESIAFQVEDVVEAVGSVEVVLADGGAAENDELMQIQSDLSGREVHRAEVADLSPLGAAHLGGIATGFWTESELGNQDRTRRVFRPAMSADARAAAKAAWRDAVARSRLSPRA
jgi:glycerol kinase